MPESIRPYYPTLAAYQTAVINKWVEMQWPDAVATVARTDPKVLARPDFQEDLRREMVQKVIQVAQAASRVASFHPSTIGGLYAQTFHTTIVAILTDLASPASILANVRYRSDSGLMPATDIPRRALDIVRPLSGEALYKWHAYARDAITRLPADAFSSHYAPVVNELNAIVPTGMRADALEKMPPQIQDSFWRGVGSVRDLCLAELRGRWEGSIQYAVTALSTWFAVESVQRNVGSSSSGQSKPTEGASSSS